MSARLGVKARQQFDALLNTTPGKELVNLMIDNAEKSLSAMLMSDASRFEHLRGELQSTLTTLKQISGKTVKIRVTIED